MCFIFLYVTKIFVFVVASSLTNVEMARVSSLGESNDFIVSSKDQTSYDIYYVTTIFGYTIQDVNLNESDCLFYFYKKIILLVFYRSISTGTTNGSQPSFPK